MDEIINKVDASGLVTIDTALFYVEGQRRSVDLNAFIAEGDILREKYFRTQVEGYNWSVFKDSFVNIICSGDHLVPHWAWMLVSSHLQPFAALVFQGSNEMMEAYLLQREVDKVDFSEYTGKRVVVKGCQDKPLPDSVYSVLVQKLQPFVKSIFYGEPCSTVPVYKQKRQSVS